MLNLMYAKYGGDYKLISIITPVYNSEKYLKRCVDSILNQTYSNFELILVDDGSADKSPQICDEYARKDSRIVVIHQKNQGQAVARNKALDICKGDYISFIDSDDYVNPQMLEILLNIIKASDSDVAVCGYIQGEEDSHNWKTKSSSLETRTYKGKDFVRKCILENNHRCWLLWDKLYKREVFAKIRLPEGRIYEDSATMYRLLYNTDKVINCNSVLYYYFENCDSTVNKQFSLKRLDILIFIQEMIEFFTENDEKELLDWANRYYLFTIADLYIKANKSNLDSSILKELKRKLKSHYHQEKVKYPITIKTYPQVFEVLHPKYSKYYWLFKALVNKIRRS